MKSVEDAGRAEIEAAIGRAGEPDLPIMVEISSEAGTSRLALRGDTMRIGRSAENDVVLNNQPTVSRHHAQLSRRSDGQWRVRDLGSHNGTHVNGVALAVDAEPVVGPDDIIGVGSVTIRIVSDAEADGLTIEDASAGAMHRLLTVLSSREREVLTLVAAGHTDDQVAASLFISVKTVHSHLDRIRDKTGLRRRAELTRLAVRLGLSSAP